MHSPVIEFKGGSFTLSTLRLCGRTLAQLDAALTQHIERAPALFTRMPVILDIEGLDPTLALAEVVALVRRHQLLPMAVSRAQPTHKSELVELDLPNLEHKAQKAHHRLPPLIIDKPVRSGQQIYAKERDLIVLSAVSAGAELMADGDIQVYGPMRGRAFAGATGDSSAYLISHNFQPELVALAGHYQTVEPSHPHWGEAVLVQLQGTALTCHALSRP
ncbi:septum site-determining protein MinC [Ferrimonas balearica]|uniref:septum site-determining protein MinC n=1 Tax=Ferrimonas balearica TaxID=44012 RepID=UPI001C996076|nr:septum site-determining protein MinC [Ferrimonas balearica]MBY5920589.1 septum site-determining protein MinC [Ferrimonas balearica]MBY5996726.1 septum site-determining protein MinC [Ferrimonas balearica]